MCDSSYYSGTPCYIELSQALLEQIEFHNSNTLFDIICRAYIKINWAGFP